MRARNSGETQVIFENTKREICEAPVLGMPTEKGMFVLGTDSSVLRYWAYFARNKSGVEGLFSDQ